MTEMQGVEGVEGVEGPRRQLLWEGTAAFFARPDGGRVIRYEVNGEDKFIALPAELVPALEMLAANPAALDHISASPMGGVARRMVKQMMSKVLCADS